MTVRTLDGVAVAGKRVLVRADLNVPMAGGKVPKSRPATMSEAPNLLSRSCTIGGMARSFIAQAKSPQSNQQKRMTRPTEV